MRGLGVVVVAVVAGLLASAVPAQAQVAVTHPPATDELVREVDRTLARVRAILVALGATNPPDVTNPPDANHPPDTEAVVKVVVREAQALVESTDEGPEPPDEGPEPPEEAAAVLPDERFAFDGSCEIRNFVLSPEGGLLATRYRGQGVAACEGTLSLGSTTYEVSPHLLENWLTIETDDAAVNCNSWGAKGVLDFRTWNGNQIVFEHEGISYRPVIEFRATLAAPGPQTITLALRGAERTLGSGQLQTSTGACVGGSVMVAPSGSLQSVGGPLESRAQPERW